MEKIVKFKKHKIYIIDCALYTLVNRMLTCEICVKSFEPNKYYHNGSQRYCSEKCRKIGIRNYQRDYMRNYMRTHPKYAIKQQKEVRKQKLIVLTHYGGDQPKCACCGESHIEFLSIDHINGNGAEQRRQIGGTQKFSGLLFYEWLINNDFPKGCQILCMNCNTAKRKSKVQFCPVHHPELYPL